MLDVVESSDDMIGILGLVRITDKVLKLVR